MSEGTEAVVEVKDFLKKHNPALIINRIPSKSKDRFIEFSNEEFCGDWGMALKNLMDLRDGIMPTGNEKLMMLEMKVEDLYSEITEIKLKIDKEKKIETIKLVSGKEILR